MNITDVGHLTGDDDTGDDKLEKGAKKTGKSVWEVAQFYTDFFLDTLQKLNIVMPNVLAKATDHIKEMIELIDKLSEMGFTYETAEAVYFDITKFSAYGKLSGQKLNEKMKGAREDTYVDPKKKNPADFALWFKLVGRFKNHSMHWSSPWDDGFPGWHIECSAMSMKYLGDTLDIHSGGIDHITVHHENEIAQSEGATGKKFVQFWFHNNFVTVEGQKMSKSLGNFYTLKDIKERGIDPLALRLLFLQSHYRQALNFTWKSAEASQEALKKLHELVIALKKQTRRTVLSQEKLKSLNEFRSRFTESLEEDLQTPKALAVMWEMVKSNIPSTDKLDLLFEFDQVLGLRLNEIIEEKIPEEIRRLADERLAARKAKDFKKSDDLRSMIEKKGYTVEDNGEEYKLKKFRISHS